MRNKNIALHIFYCIVFLKKSCLYSFGFNVIFYLLVAEWFLTGPGNGTNNHADKKFIQILDISGVFSGNRFKGKI